MCPVFVAIIPLTCLRSDFLVFYGLICLGVGKCRGLVSLPLMSKFSRRDLAVVLVTRVVLEERHRFSQNVPWNKVTLCYF